MNKEKNYKILVIVWLAFSIWAVILQVFLQEYMAKITPFGLSPGWQREIGIWNLGLCVIIIQVLRMKVSVTKILVPGLLLLNAFFGLNHLTAAVKNPGFHGSWSGSIMNFYPIIWAFIIYIYYKRKERKEIKENY